jgi:hypothetical protein
LNKPHRKFRCCSWHHTRYHPRRFEANNVAADLAARDAFTAAVDAAVDAAVAAGFADEFIKGPMRDYQTLQKLRLGFYPEAGHPIDSSPAGPLGKL